MVFSVWVRGVTKFFRFGKGSEDQLDQESCKLNLIWILVLGRRGDDGGHASQKSYSSEVKRMIRVTRMMTLLPLSFKSTLRLSL